MLKFGNENQFSDGSRKKSEEGGDKYPNITILCTGWERGVIMMKVYLSTWFKRSVNVPISLI